MPLVDFSSRPRPRNIRGPKASLPADNAFEVQAEVFCRFASTGHLSACNQKKYKVPDHFLEPFQSLSCDNSFIHARTSMKVSDYLYNALELQKEFLNWMQDFRCQDENRWWHR
jgi:hypothetical protein